VQKRAAEARVQDLEDEKSKPFARTRYVFLLNLHEMGTWHIIFVHWIGEFV
jgi:hypothetical protein